MIIDRLASIHPSVKRHALKTITWRVVGTVDSIALAWIVTGDPMVGLKIGGLELFTKMILYFIHERVWYKINFGLPHRTKETGVRR